MYDTVYVSPHLDDAVISCAGRMLQDRAAGRRVLVLSVFTAGAPDERARKSEDREAAAALGVDTEWLDFPDAPWRHRYYRSSHRLLFGLHPDDREFLKRRLRPALSDALHRANPRIVFFPLGVGTHIDHRLVHAAACGPVGYYEDRPYVFLKQSLRIRLVEIGACVRPLPADLRAGSAASFRTSFQKMAYVRAYLHGEDRRKCLAEILRRLRAACSLSRGGSLWRFEIVRCPTALSGQVCAAVSRYATQVGTLFGASYRRTVFEYSRRLGVRGYVERYWWGR